MIKPYDQWILVKVIEKNSVAISQEQMADTEQKGEIVAVGTGEYIDRGVRVQVDMSHYKKGDIIVWIKHAEANTPEDVKREGYRLIEATKVMGLYERGTK